MEYSFLEEVKAFPERWHPASQVIDWGVAWRGRQQVRSAEPWLLLDPEIQQLLQPSEQEDGSAIKSIKIQVFNTPSDTWEANSLPVAAVDDDDDMFLDAYSSTAGLSVTVAFSLAVGNGNHTMVNQSWLEVMLKDKFRHVLLQIFSHRWVLGSLESVQHERLHRFVHVDWQNVKIVSSDDKKKDTDDFSQVVVPVVLMLPHEAFSLSPEGVRAFIDNFYPCGSSSGILASHSAKEWSHILLGYEESSTLSSTNVASSSSSSPISTLSGWGRRGMWIRWAAQADGLGYDMDLGLVWSMRTKGPYVTWSNLLGNGTSWRSCPLVDATHFQLLDSPAVPVKNKCDGLTPAEDILQKTCLLIPTDKARRPTTTNVNSAKFLVQANLRRTQGPGHGGRIETLVDNQHASCDARVKIWHVIPPVLKPIWSTFASSSDTSLHPQRQWKEDGTLMLTMVTNMTSQSSLRYGFDYLPVLLPIESFPADPNRGFELPPVRVIVEPLCEQADALRLPPSFAIFSQSLLFLTPLPDASMPFNVLSLSCTLVAFVVGSILNLLVRRASEKIKYALHPELKPKSGAQRIREKIKELLRRPSKTDDTDTKEKED